GRYLFHGQLPELQEALTAPEKLADFAARHELDGFLIHDFPATLPTTRVYPDGTRRDFARPWHAVFFPRGRWALVYFDQQALLFVDRARVAPEWLSAHEYRWLRLGDEAARGDALACGEIPAYALAAEA